MKPDDFISSLRDTDLYIEKIYLNGGCYQFSKLLKSVFSEGETFINEAKNHVATKIDGIFYDIAGITTERFFPLTKEDELMCEQWSFSKDYWLYRVCENCDEPVFAPA